MKVAIVGSRNILDSQGIFKVLDRYNITHVVSGGAKGVDSIGHEYAVKKDLPVTVFLPDWKRNRRRAGYMRNNDIIKNSEYVLAFWDMESKGTKHSIDLAKETYSKPVDVWVYKNDEWQIL